MRWVIWESRVQLWSGLSEKALAGAKFPYINANVIDAKTGKPLFTPFIITNNQVTDSEGKTHNLRIGYIGFVPPQIMVWDKTNLQGKVTVADITETAKNGCRKYANKVPISLLLSAFRPFCRTLQNAG